MNDIYIFSLVTPAFQLLSTFKFVLKLT